MNNQLTLALSSFIYLVMACEEMYPYGEPASESAGSPSITFFNPESAECGTEITLYGDGFGTSVSKNMVTFDSWGSEAHSGRIGEVTKVPHLGVVIVRVPMNLVPGDYTISLQANGRTHSSEKTFKITGD